MTTYRNFEITYDPPPIPTRNCDWSYSHKDFDGPGDNRYGHAPSEEAARAEIDLWYHEEFECPRCREASPDSCLALVCPDRKDWRAGAAASPAERQGTGPGKPNPDESAA